MHGNEDGETGADDDVAAQRFEGTPFSLNWIENSGQQTADGSIIRRHD